MEAIVPSWILQVQWIKRFLILAHLAGWEKYGIVSFFFSHNCTVFLFLNVSTVCFMGVHTQCPSPHICWVCRIIRACCQLTLYISVELSSESGDAGRQCSIHSTTSPHFYSSLSSHFHLTCFSFHILTILVFTASPAFLCFSMLYGCFFFNFFSAKCLFVQFFVAHCHLK